MIYQKPLTTLLILLTSLPVTALAQDAPSTRTLRARSISFQVDGTIPDLYAHSPTAGDEAAEGVPVEVKSYLNHEAADLILKNDRVIFTTSSDRSSLTDSEKVMAKVQVPESFRSAVLMFLPGDGKKDSPKYQVLPIDDDTRSFPRGSFKVINLGPIPLRITLEKKIWDFRPGQTRVIEEPPVNNRNASAMRAYKFADEQWQGIGATSWPHPGRKRVIHVAFYNPSSKKIELRGIRDIAVRDAADTAEAAGQ
jgi:hypothetical protein